jgi:adenylate cyclase
MKILLHILSRRSVQIVLLLAMLGGAVFLRLQDPPAIGRLRQMTFDTYNRLMPRRAFDDVRIVDLDEESIRQIGQWPWPRPLVGDLAATLRKAGARAVVFDIVFSEPDRTSPARIAKALPDTPEMKSAAAALATLPDNDETFAQKIRQAGNVVTGFVAANQETSAVPEAKARIFNTGRGLPDPARYVEGFRYFTTTLPGITAAAAGNGSFVMTPESDGVVRRVPMLVTLRGGAGSAVFPSLSLEAVRVAEGKDTYQVESFGPSAAEAHELGVHGVTVGAHKVPTDENGRIWVYYAGHRPGLYAPAWKFLSGAVPPDVFRDKIVLVGTSAIGLLDLRASPLNPVLPGVEVHAELIEQILHGQFLHRPGFFEGAELVAMVAVSLCVIFLAPFVGAGTLAAVIMGLISGSFAWSVYAYGHDGWLIAPVYPSLTVVVIFIVSSILTNLRTEMEKRAVRTAFGHYLSPTLIEELARDPSKLKLVFYFL